MVYPISAHCMKFQRDEDGGFVVEAATIQDPIGFATALCDEQGIPLWGEELSEALRSYRYYTGLLTMVNDANHGTAWVDEQGRDRYSFDFSEREHEQIDSSLQFAREVLLRRRAPSASTRPACSARTSRAAAGWAATRSARSSTRTASATTCAGCSSATASVVPRTLSVNPSLTIMSLASRLAEYLASGAHGYFSAAPAVIAT